jgi:peroxidase
MLIFGLKHGCDASILLNGVNGEEDEKQHDANFALKEEALQTIENLRAIIRKQCLRVVSCADILVIAAREAVRQVIYIYVFSLFYFFFLFI